MLLAAAITDYVVIFDIRKLAQPLHQHPFSAHAHLAAKQAHMAQSMTGGHPGSHGPSAGSGGGNLAGQSTVGQGIPGGSSAGIVSSAVNQNNVS